MVAVAEKDYQYSVRVSVLLLSNIHVMLGDDHHMAVMCLPSPQASIEKALHAFVHEFQQTVGPFIIAMVQQVQTTDPSADFASLRLKEAGK